MAKIMLVEDDNNLREIYEARLMAEGYEIVAARDGEEALAIAVKERPDLIISDVMMPKISGFDMLDILRSTPETKNVKVIMMTALSQVEDKERAAKLGADKYLVKSQVTLEDVAKVAREVLEGTPAAPTAEAATADTPAAVANPVTESANAGAGIAAAVAATAAEPAVPTPPAADPAPASVPDPTPPVDIPPPSVATPADPVAPDPVVEPPVTVNEPAASTASAINVTDLSEPAVPTPPAADPAPASVPDPTPSTETTSDDVSLPPALQDADIVKPASEVWTMDAATPAESKSSAVSTPAEPANQQKVDAAEARIDAVDAPSIEDEEAAIAKQIETMIGDSKETTDSTVAVEAQAPDDTAQTAPSADNEPPTPQAPTTEGAAPTPPATPETPAEEPVKTAGQKVIQPINDPTKPTGPDIHELAAKEEAIEAQHTGGSVIAPTDQTAAPKDPGAPDPNSLAL